MSKPKIKGSSLLLRNLVIIFVFLTVGIGIAGFHYYKNQKLHLRKEAHNQLDAIADLKADQIASWRDRRLEDAVIVSKQSSFVPFIHQWLESPSDTHLRKTVSAWLTLFQENKNYKSIILADPAGNIKLSFPQPVRHLDKALQKNVAESVKTKEIILSDFNQGAPDEPVHLVLVIPLFTPSVNKNLPFGIIILEIDPYQFLYPLIQTWPTTSNTAETLLVRREGNEVIFLNELRHQKNTPITLRLPLSRNNLPATMAVQGVEGVVEGIDYRDRPVIAVLRQIQGSPWYLVAKIDKHEVYGLLKIQTGFLTVIVVLLILVSGFILVLLWRQQHFQFKNQQYETEEDLRKSREDLNRAQTVGHMGNWRLNRRQNQLVWSDENYRIFGIQKGTHLTHETFLNTVHPDDRAYVNAQWKAGLEGKPFDIEHRILADGQIKWIREKAFVEFDKNGLLLGGFGITQDITKRKLAEEALKKSEERFRTLVENAHDIIHTMDQYGIITYISPNCKDMLGHDDSEVIGQSFERFVHPNDVPACRAFLDRLLTTGEKESNIEYRIQHQENTWRWYSTNASLLRHANGTIIGIARDITERKQAEESLKKARNELESRVHQRTAELKGVVEALQDEMDERKQAEEKLKATNALLSLFSQKTSRKDYLDAVVALIHSWSGCRCAGIRILDNKGNIPYETHLGFSRKFWESESQLSVNNNHCICTRVIIGNPNQQDLPMMTPGGSFHCENTANFFARLSEENKTRFRGVCIQHSFLSLSIIPIRYGNKVFGTIHLADEKKKKVSLELIEFLESISPLIGEAVNRFNLKDELHNSESHLRLLSSQLLTVQEDERKRIAAELHDDVTAKLAAIKFSLEQNIMQTDQVDTKATKDALKNIIAKVLDTIVSTRRIMVNLRPAMIDDLGIIATLSWYCREFEQIFTAIRVQKQITIEETEIPDRLKIVIFRIAQEGMNNIAKHSGANQISLVLKKNNGDLSLSIEDNGRGFELGHRSDNSKEFQGIGIVNMKERARLSGGEFSISSVKKKGTSLCVSWSLKPSAPDSHLRIEPS